MIEVKDVEKYGKLKEEENLKFRKYLKNKADIEILDKQFKELNDKYFKIYHCKNCMNCCKKLGAIIYPEELEKISKELNISKEKLISKYLKEDLCKYKTKNNCDFLSSDNEWLLKSFKPECCKEYPFLDKDDRLFNLLSIIENTKVCPVVYEIIEELKILYNFK